jgi:CHASE3 domain sensor protein
MTRWRVDLWNALGVVAALVFFIVSGAIAFMNIQVLRDDNRKLLHSNEVITALDQLLSTVQDAETGQRGFLLTGNNRYLDPYNNAVASLAARLNTIGSLTVDNGDQQRNLSELRGDIVAKLAELKQTIDLYRTGDSNGALAVVTTDRGKVYMDQIRTRLAVMQQEEDRLRQVRLAEMEVAYRTAWTSGLLSALLGIVLTLAIGFLLQRASHARARQDWLRAGQVGLSEAMLGDKTVEELGNSMLAFLAKFLGSHAAVLFKGDDINFRRAAQLGVPSDASITERFVVGEGLLGQVAGNGRSLALRDVPEGYLTIGSAFGRDKPRHLLIAPFTADGDVNAVIELGFLHSRRPHSRSARLGVSLRWCGAPLSALSYRPPKPP